MQVYQLRHISLFYPFHAESAAATLNEMRQRVDTGSVFYTPFDQKDVGLFSFLIGEDRPFALILPGGGYNDVCSLIEGYTTALEFNKLGYNAFVGNYRVGKAAHYPNPQADVAQMLTFIFDHAEVWKVSKKNYAVAGFSAGGHLAATWGLKQVGYGAYHLPKPNTLFLAYPLISLQGGPVALRCRKLFLQEDAETEVVQRQYSVQLQVDAHYPKTFLWQCSADPLKDSALLAESLHNAGVRHEYQVYDGGAHGVGAGIGTVAEGWIAKAVTLWEE